MSNSPHHLSIKAEACCSKFGKNAVTRNRIVGRQWRLWLMHAAYMEVISSVQCPHFVVGLLDNSILP